MLRRVELAWPITDAAQRQRIIDEGLVACMEDNVYAWDLLADGTYVRVRPEGRRAAHGAQAALMARYNDPDA